VSAEIILLVTGLRTIFYHDCLHFPELLEQNKRVYRHYMLREIVLPVMSFEWFAPKFVNAITLRSRPEFSAHPVVLQQYDSIQTQLSLPPIS